MKIVQFTEKDIREAAEMAYPKWGVGHAGDGRGKDLVLSCANILCVMAGMVHHTPLR